jgi:DNA-directed RNA polymerase subunit beta'
MNREKKLSPDWVEQSSPIFQKLKIVSNSLKEPNSVDEEKTLVSSQTKTLVSNNLLESETRNLGTPFGLDGYSRIQELKMVKIGLASSDRIVQWAEKMLPNKKIFGEVLNANTLHYKTFKPHKGGLFCERIFGPLKDFECACGIKKRPLGEEAPVQNLLSTKKSPRNFCPTCDVEYTWSVIRRYQLGYIRLVSPVTHVWYLRTNPNYLSLLLDLRKKELEAIIYCMQTTTLEYYWKPMHSLQLNLTASTLFNSYRKFLSLNSEKNSAKSKKRTRKEQIKIREWKKRENLTLQRFCLNTKKQYEELEAASLESKIEYLEKSFKLTNNDIYPITLAKISRVTGFLKTKTTSHFKRNLFGQVYKKVLKDFYFESYKIASNRAVRSENKISQTQTLFQASTFLFDKLSNNQTFGNLENTTPIYLTLFPFLDEENLNNQKRKKNNYKLNFQTLQTLKTNSLFWKNEKSYMYSDFLSSSARKNFSNSSTKFSKFKKASTFDQKSVFLTNFSKLVRRSHIEKKWKSIYQNHRQSIQFLETCYSINFQKKVVESSQNLLWKQLSQSFVFLYVLFTIQKTNNLAFQSTNESLTFDKDSMLSNFFVENKTLLTKFRKLTTNKQILEFLNLSSKQELKIFSKFSNPELSYVDEEEENQDLQLLEFIQLGKIQKMEVTKLFSLFFNEIGQKLLALSYRRDLKIYLKTIPKQFNIFLFSKTSMYLDKLNLLTSSNVTRLNFSETILERILFSPFRDKRFLFVDKLGYEQKIFQFVRNTEFYSTTTMLYLKNLVNLTRDLSLLKDRKLNSSNNIFNNISTVSYSMGWETEKDWKYFLYYNTSPIDISDKLMVNYKYRFAPNLSYQYSFTPAIPIIGAHLIQKLLHEYEGLEVKKMATQYQNILPKLNRYIRIQKQNALKKSDFVEIQRLLQKRDFIVRRLKFLRKIFKKNSKTSSMVLNTLPVLPPDLRPILKMQNQIAASDLNRFYQRILYRNDRLKKFLRANASFVNYEAGFEIKYAQRLLQEAVDNLIQNGKGHVKPETNSRGQPLKSLSEILKGKQGRFRQYLLGKRVDYSGRSVIVVGPSLKIYQCGLPFEMAMELFLPFLIKRIFQYNLARTVVGAKTLLQTQKELTWNLLEEIMKNHPILLNRAPTLHRLGIQAFQPKLIEGRAILLHPLVCPAFNADFDGDQMAVHVPITVEARTEAWKLMFSRNHLISPATGEPMLLPSQDMVLGCYYLTTEAMQSPKHHSGRPFILGTQFYFSNMKQVLQAYLQERIHLQTPIWIKWNGQVQMEPQSSQPLEIRLDSEGSWLELRPKFQKHYNSTGEVLNFFMRTTAGRVLFNTMVENCLQN